MKEYDVMPMEPVKAANHYLVQLTSLRGVACLIVLVGHVIQVVNYMPPGPGLGLGQLQSMITGGFNAEGAVLLFFVLSGCVLALSLRNVHVFDSRALGSFYVKRIFRLYPLLWLSTGFAVVSMLAARHLAGTGIFVDWLTRNLTSPITTPHTILSLIGAYTRYNGPMWSLRAEIIYSALFPATYILIRNRRTRGWCIAALAVIAVLPIDAKYCTAFGLSFALGALIPMLPRWTVKGQGAIAILALLVLLYDRVVLAGLNPPVFVFDIIETLASFFVVRDVYASGRSYQILISRPVAKLGELSFSVYLLHLPIFLIIFAYATDLLGLNRLVQNPGMAQIGLSLVTATITIFVSVFTYRYLELPLHNIGRRLGKAIAARRQIPQDRLNVADDANVEIVSLR